MPAISPKEAALIELAWLVRLNSEFVLDIKNNLSKNGKRALYVYFKDKTNWLKRNQSKK